MITHKGAVAIEGDFKMMQYQPINGRLLVFLAMLAPACAAPEAQETGTLGEQSGEAVSAYTVSGYTWQLPYRGGEGGGPYNISCGNAVAAGVFGRSGAYVDQLGLICAELRQDGSLGPAWTTNTAGGNGGGSFYAVCPDGQALVGLTGRSGRYVDQIGIQCAPVSAWLSSGSPWYSNYAGGGSGGNPYGDTCRKGYMITSINGRSGSYVDAQQPVCTYVSQ